MNITIQDYRDYCESRSSCKDCSLLNGYQHCMGFIADNPEAADKIISQWINRPSTYIIVDKYDTGESAIKGIAYSKEEANKLFDKICSDELINCLAETPEESGVHWGEMTEQEQKEFYEKEIKSSFSIVERRD